MKWQKENLNSGLADSYIKINVAFRGWENDYLLQFTLPLQNCIVFPSNLYVSKKKKGYVLLKTVDEEL